MSPAQPYENTYSHKSVTSSEMYVRVFDVDGNSLVNAERVTVYPQARNFVGVSIDPNGRLQLEALQSLVSGVGGDGVDEAALALKFSNS